MINKSVKPGTAAGKIETPRDKKENSGVGPMAEKGKTKKKKGQHSALAAAAQGESAVSEANARSTGDVGFGKTGTNLTYKEDGGIL